MAVIFDGRALAQKKKERLKQKRKKACLVALQVGRNPSSDLYLRLKAKMALELGVEFQRFNFPASISATELISFIQRLNSQKKVDGIMIQLPLPKTLKQDEEKILRSIVREKDVDGLTGCSPFLPATVRAVWEILKEAGINQKTIIGKNACILGRSNTVGKPLANLLIDKGATVSVCHSHTKNIAYFSQKADILISATGVPGLVKAKMVKRGAIVIDVGSPRAEVEFSSVVKKASFITPVPGGVGPLTVVCLFENLFQAVDFSTKELHR